uniref:Uncharacterized protein n=1 Tax=Solanum tuberosum TaxID=4113 RepID=M1CEQ8_SOLTU
MPGLSDIEQMHHTAIPMQEPPSFASALLDFPSQVKTRIKTIRATTFYHCQPYRVSEVYSTIFTINNKYKYLSLCSDNHKNHMVYYYLAQKLQNCDVHGKNI